VADRGTDEVGRACGAFTTGRTDRCDDASRFGAPAVAHRDDGDGEQDDSATHPCSVRRGNWDNNHPMRAYAVMIGIGTAAAACGGAVPAPSSAAEMPLPALTLPLIGGGTWSSTSARGAPLVIDVWASWCKPCSKGFPKLDSLAAQDPRVTVVAISIDEDAAAIREFVAEFPLAVPIAHDAEQIVTRAPLHIARLPTVLIVDEEGRIRHRLEEPSERDYDALGELVGSAIDEPGRR
jgi:thiol-disulfide isomerase/thioredoxin